MSQRVGGDSSRRLSSETTKSVGLEGKVESHGDARCFGTRKGPDRLGTTSAELSRKHPFSAESKDKRVLLICHNLPGTFHNLSGPSMTGTIVSVLPPSGGGCDMVIHLKVPPD